VQTIAMARPTIMNGSSQRRVVGVIEPWKVRCVPATRSLRQCYLLQQ